MWNRFKTWWLDIYTDGKARASYEEGGKYKPTTSQKIKATFLVLISLLVFLTLFLGLFIAVGVALGPLAFFALAVLGFLFFMIYCLVLS